MVSGRSGRKRLLVNKPYQYRFIAEILLVILLAITLSAGAAYFLIHGELSSGRHSSEEKLLHLQHSLPGIFLLPSIISFVAMALLGGFITLRETHRVIGPISKMERKFVEMAEGDFSYIMPFRKADELKGLDEFINIHLNNLSDFFTIMDKMEREIVPLLAALERSEGDYLENLGRIRSLLAELDHYAEAFRPAL